MGEFQYLADPQPLTTDMGVAPQPNPLLHGTAKQPMPPVSSGPNPLAMVGMDRQEATQSSTLPSIRLIGNQ